MVKNAGKQTGDRARMNRQRQREREVQRQRERQQNNDMMTEGVVLMSLWPRAINLLISNWSRTRKFSQSFKNYKQGRQRLFTFLTIVTCCSRSTSNFYAVIGQNLTGEFMQKIYTASWNLFTLTAEAYRVFCQFVMFLLSFSTGYGIKWNTAAMNSLLLFMAGLFIEFLVEKCAGCQSRKSDFGWHRFVFHLAGCWLKSPSSDSGLTG